MGQGLLNAPNNNAPPVPLTTAVTLTIENAWAVRGLVNQHSHCERQRFQRPHQRGFRLHRRNLWFLLGTCTDTPSSPRPWRRDVDLNLNFSSVDAAGTFNSNATYTITATIN